MSLFSWEEHGPVASATAASPFSARVCRSVLSALDEDRRGVGLSVTTQLAQRLEAVRKDGRDLDKENRRVFESLFGCHLGKVRVCSGHAAQRMAAELGATAFCIDFDIILGSQGLDAGGSPRSEVLFHELAHMADNPDPSRLRFWLGEHHRAITRSVCPKYVGLGPLLEMLTKASNAMDYRPRRLRAAVIPYVKSKLPDFAGGEQFPPEGPEHGEGGMYKLGLAAARKKNLVFQQTHVRKAASYYRQWRKLVEQQSKKWPPSETHYRTHPFEKVVKHLGDALHVAQDRGAHWEGARNMGHRDPRYYRTGWDCDDPKFNRRGYKLAEAYTEGVMKEFVKLADYKICVRKKKIVKAMLEEEFNLRGEHAKLLAKAIDLIGTADDVGAITEVAGLIAGGTVASAVGTGLTIAGIILFPIGSVIALVNARETGQRMYGMRAVAYATTAWAFGDVVPSQSAAILKNAFGENVRLTDASKSKLKRYQKAWKDASQATVQNLQQTVQAKKVSRQAYQTLLKAVGDGNRQKLCMRIHKGWESELSGVALRVWKSGYVDEYPD